MYMEKVSSDLLTAIRVPCSNSTIIQYLFPQVSFILSGAISLTLRSLYPTLQSEQCLLASSIATIGDMITNPLIEAICIKNFRVLQGIIDALARPATKNI